MHRKLLMAIVAAVLSGCSAEPETTESALMGPGGPDVITYLLLGPSGYMEELGDGDARDFDIMWGPITESAPTFTGHYDPAKCQVRCDSGYIYVAGRLAATTPPTAPLAPLIAPWPTVVTSHIRAAADGTYFIVEVTSDLVKVYRLKAAASGTMKVYIDTGSGTQTMNGTDAEVVVATLATGTWSTAAPRALTTSERSWADGVVATAAASGIRTPP